MYDTVKLSVEQGLATLRIGREHGNAINGQLLRELMAASGEVEADPGIRGVLLAASGKLFCPGFDLQELAELDRPSMGLFLSEFSRCMLALYTFSKPLVAALHGHTIAGGCILSLTADWRVLREHALVGLNEVRVGVPFPFGVSLILRESVARPRIEEVALFGRNYSGPEAVATGLVHEIHPAEGFEEFCRGRLDELAGRDSRAFSISKRYLRWATTERIQAHDSRLAREFLDAWFSPKTRERVQQLLADLRSK